MRLNLYILIASFMVTPAAGFQAPGNSPASALVVNNFTAREERALEVLQALAQQSHIAIGVSGEIMGPIAN